MTKALKRHGSPEAITTDGLRSYRAAMNELGNADKQEVGRWANNRASLAAMLTAVPPAASGLEQQLVASHVLSLLADHLVDIPTSDRHVVKPWFNGKIDFSPPTPDLAAQGFPLAGGRLDYIGGRTVAAIVYRRGLHTINLFVSPTILGEPVGTAQVAGYTVRQCARNGLSYYAVSDVAPADLARFEASFEAAP